MTRVTVTIDNKTNARLFVEMVNAIRFVKDIQQEDDGNDNLSKEELKLLESRWNDYLKNPKKVQTWGEVKAELAKKYAR